MPLDQALNASPIDTAFTRREPDQRHPVARVIVVIHHPNADWEVYEYTLDSAKGTGGMNGWPMQDYRDAEAYTAYRLDVPRAAVWWPAPAPLEIGFANGMYMQMVPTP